MAMTERQQKVATECLLFCFFNPGDKTAVKARCLSALKALDLDPAKEIESCLPSPVLPQETSSFGFRAST